MCVCVCNMCNYFEKHKHYGNTCNLFYQQKYQTV